MNISPLIYDCTKGYDGVAVEIYVSGCTRGCKGCHNPQMQSFSHGYSLKYGELWRNLDYNKEWFDIISILGGDLLCQDEVSRNTLMYRLHKDFPHKKLWLYTGAELSEVPQWCLDIFDVIKTGPYIESLRQSEGLASSNQKYNYKGVDFD